MFKSGKKFTLGQPTCGILGNRAYLGSGSAGLLFSLDRSNSGAAQGKVQNFIMTNLFISHKTFNVHDKK